MSRISMTKAQRSEFRARGICTYCGKQPATPGWTSCPRCREMNCDPYLKLNSAIKKAGNRKTTGLRRPVDEDFENLSGIKEQIDRASRRYWAKRRAFGGCLYE